MTDDELYEAFEKAFPEAEDYAKTYAHVPLDRYKAPYDDMFEGFDAGVRVVEERITALEERLELWAEDGEGNKVSWRSVTRTASAAETRRSGCLRRR